MVWVTMIRRVAVAQAFLLGDDFQNVDAQPRIRFIENAQLGSAPPFDVIVRFFSLPEKPTFTERSGSSGICSGSLFFH